MQHRQYTKPALAALASSILCAACGVTTQRAEGVQKVDDLLARIECVQVDAVVSKGAARAALDQLNALCSPDFTGDAKEAYATLLDKIALSENQAKALHMSVEPMRQSAESIFAKWTSDLAAFGSTTMRQRSQARLDDTRARYQAVFSSAQSALISYDAYNADLHDHALFLGHDLNSAAVAELRGDVTELENAVSALDARLDQCSNAARLYVESSALHGQVEVVETVEPEPEPVAEPANKGTATTRSRSSTLKRRTTATKPATQPTGTPVTAPAPTTNPPPPQPGQGTEGGTPPPTQSGTPR